MNESLISLLGIATGIFGMLVFTKIKNIRYFGFTGNIIASVFGSILFTKSVSRIGLNPTEIYANNHMNFKLLIAYLFISFLGSIFFLAILHKLNSVIKKVE